jgi:hypothetical protein
VTRFVEVGSGKVLAGSSSASPRAPSTIAVGTADDIAAYKDPERVRRKRQRRRQDVRFDGQEALVTGATGGIGGASRGCCMRRARAWRCPERARRLEALAAKLGERARMCCRAIFPTRLRSRRWCQLPREAMGGLDILVNNAGVTRDNLFVRLKDEDWDSVINVNLTATFRPRARRES